MQNPLKNSLSNNLWNDSLPYQKTIALMSVNEVTRRDASGFKTGAEPIDQLVQTIDEEFDRMIETRAKVFDGTNDKIMDNRQKSCQDYEKCDYSLRNSFSLILS